MPDTQPVDDGRGLIAHWIDHVFGCRWEQKVRSGFGFSIAAIMVICGIMQSITTPTSFPWIDSHLPQLKSGAFILTGVIYGISKRINTVPGPINPKGN